MNKLYVISLDVFRALRSCYADTFFITIGAFYTGMLVNGIVSSQADFASLPKELHSQTLLIASVSGALGYLFFVLSLFNPFFAAKIDNKMRSITISSLAAFAFILMKLLLNRLGLDHAHWDILSKSYVIVIMLCVLAPIIEEYFFRGLLWQLFRGRDISEAAILITTSLLFTFGHFAANVIELLQILFAGVCLGVMRMYSGSVYLGIVIHAVTNFIVLFNL